MDRKEKIHELLKQMAEELLAYIKERKDQYGEGWVPSVNIKKELELNFEAVPKQNEQYGEKGWLFAILARSLEDRGLVEYKKVKNRAFYRSV